MASHISCSYGSTYKYRETINHTRLGGRGGGGVKIE